MTIVCAVCKTKFESKRAHARYCSSTCRSRKERARRPKVGGSTSSRLVATTKAELRQAGVLDTSLGQQAVALAQRIASPASTGSSVAALSRELRAVMGEVLRDADVERDLVSEMQDSRERKLRAVS